MANKSGDNRLRTHTIRCYDAKTDASTIESIFRLSIEGIGDDVYSLAERQAWIGLGLDSTLIHNAFVAQSIEPTKMVSPPYMAFLAFQFIAPQPKSVVDIAEISFLYTLPKHQRQGLASALLTCFFTHMIEQHPQIQVCQTQASLVSKHFFAHHGFTVTADKHIVRNQQNLHCFNMQKVMPYQP